MVVVWIKKDKVEVSYIMPSTFIIVSNVINYNVCAHVHACVCACVRASARPVNEVAGRGFTNISAIG